MHQVISFVSYEFRIHPIFDPIVHELKVVWVALDHTGLRISPILTVERIRMKMSPNSSDR